MSENNDEITISTASVQDQQQNQTTDQQAKAVKAKGDKAQQKVIQAQNAENNTVPIDEQPQTLDVGITNSEGQTQSGLQAGNSAPATNQENINVEDFINETNIQLGNEDAEKKARAEKKELLARAIKSLERKSTVQKINVTTNELIAEYIEYLPDTTQKTVFDYIKDPTVSQHIEFQFPEGKKEGDKLTSPITAVWIDANF